MTEEIKKFAKEYVQNNTDESVNSFIGEQLQKAFIEGTDFMYYSNNEELKKELTEKDKQIAELKKIEEEYYDFIQKKNEEDWKGDNVVGCLKLKIETSKAIMEMRNHIEALEAQIEKLIDFTMERTECCDVCPITDTCINSEGTCPYAGILAKGEEAVTRKWLMRKIAKEIKENE